MAARNARTPPVVAATVARESDYRRRQSAPPSPPPPPIVGNFRQLFKGTPLVRSPTPSCRRRSVWNRSPFSVSRSKNSPLPFGARETRRRRYFYCRYRVIIVSSRNEQNSHPLPACFSKTPWAHLNFLIRNYSPRTPPPPPPGFRRSKPRRLNNIAIVSVWLVRYSYGFYWGASHGPRTLVIRSVGTLRVDFLPLSCFRPSNWTRVSRRGNRPSPLWRSWNSSILVCSVDTHGAHFVSFL